MIVSRPGDMDAPCGGGGGCGAGDYWLDLNVAGASASDPDPVITFSDETTPGECPVLSVIERNNRLVDPCHSFNR